MEEQEGVRWKVQREFQVSRLEVQYRAEVYERIVPLDGVPPQAVFPCGLVIDDAPAALASQGA